MLLLLLLLPLLCLAEECPEGNCKKKDAGVMLLQGVRKHSKLDAASVTGCAAEGEDPFDPSFGRRSCCAGLERCGPYFQESWGGWSFTCSSSCRDPRADDCGCVPPEGWSRTRGRCRRGSDTDEEEAKGCRDKTSTTFTAATTETSSTSEGTTEVTTTAVTTTVSTTSFTGGEGPTPTHLNVMSWNVFFGNTRFDAMSDMLNGRNIDIANLQETNNKLSQIAEESGYTSVNSWKQSHDWCGYNFHSAGWGSAWSKELDVPGSRGVCGAMIFKGEAKFCIWGIHPIQRGNNVRYAKESIEIAAEDMKYCSETYNAPSIFLGDFNTADWRGARRKLESETGWGWSLAAKHDIDFIFIQSSPLKVGEVESSEIVGDRTCWPGFPPNNGISRECGYADHSPLWARIRLP